MALVFLDSPCANLTALGAPTPNPPGPLGLSSALGQSSKNSSHKVLLYQIAIYSYYGVVLGQLLYRKGGLEGSCQG